MSTAQPEPNCPPVDNDAEKRNAENRANHFGRCTVGALLNFAMIIFLYMMFRFWSTAIQTTHLHFIPPRFPWAINLIATFVIYSKYWPDSNLVIPVFRFCVSNLRNEMRSWGIHNNNFEDWILANLCVMAGLSTLYFVLYYWFRIILLIVRTLFYWTCTMVGFILLFMLVNRTMRFYRKVKGQEYKPRWKTLVLGFLLELYNVVLGTKNEGPLVAFLIGISYILAVLAMPLDVFGFQIGRGPAFDRLPDEWKAERRRCKTWDDITDFFAIFAGTDEDEDDKGDDLQDRNDKEEAYFPPSAFEREPNPVIFRHLRSENLNSPDCRPFVGKVTSDSDLEDTTRAGEIFPPDAALSFDEDNIITENNLEPSSVHGNTGPATMFVKLPYIACPQCDYVYTKRFQVNKHFNQMHNHRFRCTYDGCEKTFGLRTNLERHEATHGERKELRCPNSWCKTPETTFTRKDNLKRHKRQRIE